MLVLLAEYTEAELWARKALELFRNNPDLLAGRSQALTRLARLNDALAISDASISQEGNSAYRWMARGDLMLARKDAVEAHCFEKAVLADNSSVVMLEIARIYRYHRKHAKALVWARKGVEKAPATACAWFVQARSVFLGERKRQTKFLAGRSVVFYGDRDEVRVNGVVHRSDEEVASNLEQH
jgi:tetratricopeptide (TPR) repeat protein